MLFFLKGTWADIYCKEIIDFLEYRLASENTLINITKPWDTLSNPSSGKDKLGKQKVPAENSQKFY